MTKKFLQRCLAEGLSLEQIGERADRHPSTVSYHLKKHGLQAVNHAVNAPRGSAISKERLEELLASKASLREIAAALGLSASTVRYWLKKHGLEPSRIGRRRAAAVAAREAGLTEVVMMCARHGTTRFVLEGRGYFRCSKCRAGAVSEQRRRAKRRLVEEAGGRCLICGYARYLGALQFHHVDPKTKKFVVSHPVIRSLERMREEARKCVLLCANCHAEVEAGMAAPPEQLSLQ